jgi:hypothetical protein
LSLVETLKLGQHSWEENMIIYQHEQKKTLFRDTVPSWCFTMSQKTIDNFAEISITSTAIKLDFQYAFPTPANYQNAEASARS